MTHPYRQTRAGLVTRYHWPKLSDPRFDALTAQGWDEIHSILLEYIETLLTAAHVYVLDLETTLAARLGPKWWTEAGIDVTAAFLDSL